jgi:hypothetical protein
MSLIYSTLNFKGTVNSSYLQDTIYNLLDNTFILPENGFNFNTFIVSKDYVARPDLISLDAYNDTKYADVLCKINGISNPFELNEGMEIIIPSISSISDFYVDLSREFNAEDDIIENSKNIYSNKSKNKNSKRKANEAIVGDSRFKIDSAGGIIIY